MDKRRVVFQGLDQVWLEGVLEQGGHRAVGVELGRRDRFLGPVVRDHDAPEPFFQLGQRFGQAEHRHHFRGHGDIEPGLARRAVDPPAEADHDVAQGAVVHVDHPFPDHVTDIDIQGVPRDEMIVDQGRQQVVRRTDGVEIAGEMQVDVLHRHDLGIAAAGRPALDTETRSERRFAQADQRRVTDPVQGITEADGGGGFTLASRGGRDRGDQDKLAGRVVPPPRDRLERDLGLVPPVGFDLVPAKSQPGRDPVDRLQRRLLRDLDVGRHLVGFGHGWVLSSGLVGLSAARFTGTVYE